MRGDDQGVVTEFVNPKYADASRMKFKKPTRLECMMQDFPKLLQKEMGAQANIGFTMFDRWFTFSPAKVSYSFFLHYIFLPKFFILMYTYINVELAGEREGSCP